MSSEEHSSIGDSQDGGSQDGENSTSLEQSPQESAASSASNLSFTGNDKDKRAHISSADDLFAAKPVEKVSEPVAEQPKETPAKDQSSDEKQGATALDSAPSTRSNNPNMKWFVVNAYSGFEQKAKRSLEERIRNSDLEEYFGEVRVPEETVVELVRGQKKTSTRKFFPGYMLVQMILNQDTWHLVKSTPKISGFIGDASDPVPLSDDEVQRIVEQVEEGAASPRARVSFEQGETVKVVDGPFTDFNGTIEEVKPEKGKVKVLISIFGRATPVELDFVQVEKV